eukprot:7388583-Prymnesium_polylepis.1
MTVGSRQLTVSTGVPKPKIRHVPQRGCHSSQTNVGCALTNGAVLAAARPTMVARSRVRTMQVPRSPPQPQSAQRVRFPQILTTCISRDLP